MRIGEINEDKIAFMWQTKEKNRLIIHFTGCGGQR